MDDGMDQKQVTEDECILALCSVLKGSGLTPRFLRTHFDEIEQEFEERKDK